MPEVEFEQHRDHLLAVAYRMLGSQGDAEDAVQEAWLRWHSADRDEIRDLRGWLTTVTARICLDQLRSARVRRETYVGQWLPEPLVERLPAAGADPAERAVRTDQVSYALLVVLERLTPEQRVALVLHDVFAVPFVEIAQVLATTPAAARQHASRARRAVTADGTPRHTAGLAEQHRVLTAFQAAVQSGDLAGLLAVLDPDAVAISDSGGYAPASPRPIVGAERVATLMAGLLRTQGPRILRQETVLAGGGLGVVAELARPDGSTLKVVTIYAIAAGRLTGVFIQLNQDKLTRVPEPGDTPVWSLPDWLATVPG